VQLFNKLTPILIVLLIVIAGVYAYLSYRQKQGEKGVKIKKKNKKNAIYTIVYKILISIPFINKYFYRLKNEYETLYPADDDSINRYVTLSLFRALLVATISELIVVLFIRDSLYIVIGLFISFLLFKYLIFQNIDSLDTKLLNQLSEYTEIVRHYYNESPVPDDAIYRSLEDCPYEISLHIQKLHDIVSATDISAELDNYIETSPNHFFLMLASIFATITEKGDKAHGSTTLLKSNLASLNDEIAMELLKRDKMNFIFNGMIYVILVPFYTLKPIELWFKSTLPQLNEFFKSPIATILQCIIIATIIISYELVLSYKQNTSQSEKESTLILKIVKVKWISDFLRKLDDRNVRKAFDVDDKLKITNAKIGLQGFRVKRFIWAIIFFVAFNAIAGITVSRYKNNLLSDFSDAFESSIIPDEEYRKDMQTAAELVTDKYNKDTSKEDIINDITESGINYTYAELMAEEIHARLKQSFEVYYKWYFLALSLLAAVLGYYMPYILLSYKAKVINMNKEDEVSRYRTIAIILMHIEGTTIYTILEWMDRFSLCFRENIQECLLKMNTSQKQALLDLKDSDPFVPFRHFVDNLISADASGVEQAFASVESDREHSKDKRKSDNEKIVAVKASKAQVITMIPFFTTMALYILFPFIQYAIEMYAEYEGIF